MEANLIPVIANVIGYTAGTICTISVLPQIRRIMRHPEEAAKQSILRNLGQAVGNTLWLAYGVIMLAWPVIGMCAVAALLNAIVTVQVTRARWRPRVAPSGTV